MVKNLAVESPVGLRRDADLPGSWDFAPLDVVHVGHSALVLGQGDALLPITAPGRWLVPGGYHLTHLGDWSRVRDLASSAARGNMSVSLPSWAARATPVSLALRPLPALAALPAFAPRHDGDDCAASLTTQLDWLADWAATADSSTAAVNAARTPLLGKVEQVLAATSTATHLRPVLVDLIGAGPGTTPTGDDLIVGMLAGLRATGARDAADLIGSVVAGLLDRTTRASRHELTAAINGRFSEALHGLVDALAQAATSHACTSPAAPPSVTAAATRLATWGATSGRDQAYGLALGISATRHQERVPLLTALHQTR